MHYYAGLPSSPRLLARTSTTPWEKPNGPEADVKRKQLGAVFNHKLGTVWEDNLAFKIHGCLDDLGVKWTNTDVVRIGTAKNSTDPVILWIGVEPRALTSEDAYTAAFRCLGLLEEFNITDVDVELRESSVSWLAGPKLLAPIDSDTTAHARHPLTHALGLSISARATPYFEGTGGLFMNKSRDSDKLLIVTARHVVLPPEQNENIKFERKNVSTPRFDILLLGDGAYKNCLTSAKKGITDHQLVVERQERVQRAVNGQDNERADTVRNIAQDHIDTANGTINEFRALSDEVENWVTTPSRVLGHVVCSPPIRFSAEEFTEDYAIIEVDDDKIDKNNFKGNVIDLGTRRPPREFTKMMYPNAKNDTSFKYSPGRQLKLEGIIPEEEMRHPTMLDADGESFLTVIHNGSASGVTIGRATGIASYTRR